VQPFARVAGVPAFPESGPPHPGTAGHLHRSGVSLPRGILRLRTHGPLPPRRPLLRVQRRPLLPPPPPRQASQRVAAVAAQPGRLRLVNATRAQLPNRARSLPGLNRDATRLPALRRSPASMARPPGPASLVHPPGQASCVRRAGPAPPAGKAWCTPPSGVPSEWVCDRYVGATSFRWQRTCSGYTCSSQTETAGQRDAAVHVASEQHVWGTPSQPDGRHLSCIVTQMILVTHKSDVHPVAAA
jgi:hypothetical protein